MDSDLSEKVRMRVLFAIALLSFGSRRLRRARGRSSGRLFRRPISTSASAARWCGSTTINPASSCAPIGARPGTITTTFPTPAFGRASAATKICRPSAIRRSRRRRFAAPGPTTGRSSTQPSARSLSRRRAITRTTTSPTPSLAAASVACARRTQIAHSLKH